MREEGLAAVLAADKELSRDEPEAQSSGTSTSPSEDRQMPQGQGEAARRGTLTGGAACSGEPQLHAQQIQLFATKSTQLMRKLCRNHGIWPL